MRVKHGPGTRRNVKFDDTEETMYIDICLPEESFWHRIPHKEAAQYRVKILEERARLSRKSLESGPSRQDRSALDANRVPLGQTRRTPSLSVGSSQSDSQSLRPNQQHRDANRRHQSLSSMGWGDGYVSPQRQE